MLGWLQGVPRDAWRDALRLGAQSSAAATLAYLVAEWLELEHFLVIMMAVTALKRSVGGTMGQSLVRFESAVVGSVLGFLAVLVVPPAWGTAPAIAIALFAAAMASVLGRSDRVLALLAVAVAALSAVVVLARSGSESATATILWHLGVGAVLLAGLAWLVWHTVGVPVRHR